MTKKVLIFSGSLRQGAFSKSIAKTLEHIAKECGLHPTYIELNDYPMPLLNQDDAHYTKFPEVVKNFRSEIAKHDGWIIVTPEHNYSIPAALKNAIDWASRSGSEQEPLCALFKLRPILLISSSIGAFAGIRAKMHLDTILHNVGALVYPKTKSFPDASSLFDDKGNFKDKKHEEALKTLVKEFSTQLLDK